MGTQAKADINRLLGQIIRKRRKQLCISQAEMADRLRLAGLDLSRQTIQKYETGAVNITLSTICRMGSVLFGSEEQIVALLLAKLQERKD